MKSILLTIIACITCLSSFGKSDVSTRFKIMESDYVDTIPVRYSHGSIYVPITIKGRTYDFMYDTGTTLTFIPESLKSTLFAKELSDKQVFSFDDKKSDNLSQGIIHEMTIGNLHINGMHGVISKCNSPYPFIFGANELYMHGIMTKIDLRQGILIITNLSHYFDDEQGCKMSCDFLSFRPVTSFNMSYGCKGKALFDTGNNSFMTIGRKYYDKSINGNTGTLFRSQIIWSGIGSTRQGVNGIEASEEKVILKINEVKMGDVTFWDMPAETSQKYTGLGCRILEYGSMIVKPRDLRLIFQPYDGSNVVQIHERTQDIAYNTSNGRVRVEIINPHSALYAKGVRKGAYLIEVDGKPVISYDDYLQVKSQINDNTPYTIKYRNPSGEIISIFIPGR